MPDMHMPSPPKLPKHEQEEFELLQKMAMSQTAIDEYNEKVTGDSKADSAPNLKTDVGNRASYLRTIPEFDGEVNPKTGERGGPKQDPLRHSDWSFNGRVSDF